MFHDMRLHYITVHCTIYKLHPFFSLLARHPGPIIDRQAKHVAETTGAARYSKSSAKKLDRWPGPVYLEDGAVSR